MSVDNEHRDNAEEQNSSVEYKYGWGALQPKFLQKRLNNAKAFLVLLTLANVLQGITTNGILKVSVTSIERRFNLLSSESGLIISGYDIAGCIALLPISYLGGKGHKPRWIGIGLMLTSLGSFMISLPHFLTGPYEYSDGISTISSQDNLTSSNLCEPIQTDSQNVTGSVNLINCKEILNHLGPYISINQMKYVLLIGQFITGVGCTPLAVLAVTFIDESVDPQVYPIYIGIYYMGALIGPAIGFIVGGQLLKVFTELEITPEDINSESPQWVGAWWVGFLISAIIMFLLAIPILGYPKKLPSNLTRKITMVNIKGHQYTPRHDSIVRSVGINGVDADIGKNKDDSLCQIKPNTENHIGKEQAIPLRIEELPHSLPQSNSTQPSDNKSSQLGITCQHLRDFLRDFVEVITNKAFMYLSISAAVLGTLVSGFSTFGPKFVESQFGKSASDAANLFGYVCIPAGAGGMLVGAFLMSGLKLGYKSSLRMCFCVSLLGLFAQFALTLHCDDIPLAGVNVPYNDDDLNNKNLILNPDNPVDSCNKNCRCSPHSFVPVCGSNGNTYYSPCFAGCTAITLPLSQEKVFLNCSCIAETITVEIKTNITSQQSLIEHSEAYISVQGNGEAKQGRCFKPCYWHDIILVGLFLVISTTFICVVPSVDLSLRCFPQELRSLAVGIQWILIRTLGTIPGPIIFGAMIDSTCLIWNTRDQCTEGPGSCVMYKNQELSFSILILSVIYKGASILFFGLALLSYTPARLVITPESPPHSPRRQVMGPSGESLL